TRRPGAIAREAGSSGRIALGALPLCLSQSRDAEIAGHHRGASAAGQLHGYAPATRKPKSAGAHETGRAWRSLLALAGAYAKDHSRGVAADFLYCWVSRRDGKGFCRAVRFRKGGEAGVDGRVRILG